jgi:hypothetical protein
MTHRTAPAALWRVGRAPDPWTLPPWEAAAPDGTFGNRFDDPQSTYRVLYGSSQRLACFLETLARFRPDLTLLAELDAIAGEDDFLSLGTVPGVWLGSRRIGSAQVQGRYADVGASDWLALLRLRLAPACLESGLVDFDAAALLAGSHRRLTQLISREVYARGFEGIVYTSRYGRELDNWALFEPVLLSEVCVFAIAADDPDLAMALEVHRLRLA